MNRGLNTIETGMRVAIVGGGPAGSFFALYLLHYAKEKGIQPDITIYEQRDKDELGPKGCKGCAGILSMFLLRDLSELGLTLPEEIIQTRIESYVVHSPSTSISISNPEEGAEIVSVYRGGGPRLSHYKNRISFDGWLLRQARERGVRVENQSVSRIWLEQEAGVEVASEKVACDLVVLASGVNSKPIPILGVDYIPPKTRIMAQEELYAGMDQVESCLGNSAHAFLVPHSGITFGSLVPKGPFINVSVLSIGEHRVSAADFLGHDIVRSILPDHYEHSCGCRPRAIAGSARNYYADRFVVVGDAAVTRLYKDGVGSSLSASREAARTVVFHGLSRRDFERQYRPFCNRAHRDNRWGRMIFSLSNRLRNYRTFMLAQHRLIGDEQNNMAGLQPFTKAAWGMFTGSYSYSTIAKMSLNPVSLARFLKASFIERAGSLFHGGATYPKKLEVRSTKVLILGNGFGGTYVLRNLVPSLNRNENVETTMVSDENYFLFSPLLHEVAMGKIETRHIAYPIRRLHWRDRFNFVRASVEKIDIGERKVVTTRGTFDFDYLVLALGSVANTSELGAGERHILTLKTLPDSRLIRNHIIGAFEQASNERDPERQRHLLTFVVAGAGYVGVQVVTELRDFIYKDLIKLYKVINPENIRVILVESGPEILGLHAGFNSYVMKHLRRMGIEVIVGSRVTNVWEERLEINGSENVSASTVIWVAGVVANPRIAELDVEKDDIGRVLVNEYMEVPGASGVYALGDCAHFEDRVSGRAIPPRAHTAVRQAKIAARNILAEIRGRDKKAYHYSSTVEAISLGTSKAVVRFYGLRVYGFPARLIWLAAYSMLVTGTYNRIRIIMDWVLSLIFGRDTSIVRARK